MSESQFSLQLYGPFFFFPEALSSDLLSRKKKRIIFELSYLHVGKTHTVCEGGLGLSWFSFQAALALLVLTFPSSHKYLWKPLYGQDVPGHTLSGSQKPSDVKLRPHPASDGSAEVRHVQKDPKPTVLGTLETNSG